MNILRKKKIILMIFSTIFFIFLFKVNVYAADENFKLSKTSIDVKLNSTGYIDYSGGDGKVTWKSDNNEIATVDEYGYIKGVKIGKTTIRATRGEENASCEVNVIYGSIGIGANAGKNVVSLNLVIGEHDSENLKVEVEDGKYEKVNDVLVSYESNNTSVVTVSDSGVLKAVKAGKATITAKAAGVSDTCEVTVYDKVSYTDFSKAQYESTINWNEETLQIKSITPNQNSSYYYIITSSKSAPTITYNEDGSLNAEKMKNTLESFYENEKDKYIYTRNMSKYTELNQDLYIWIFQQTYLGDAAYYKENGVYNSYATKLLVSAKKIERAKLPQLNLIIQSISLGKWKNTKGSDNYTYINFNYPSVTKKRKFTLKIGKVTDNSILSKIQKNDYTGVTELLKYAKENKSVYSKTLTTTDITSFKSETSLFDGNKLLSHKGYYYIYVKFDDENGKYYPIEGVTLGQAYLYSTNDNWDLWAYTADNFKWDGLTVDSSSKKTTSTANKKTEKDNTTASGKLPYTGTGFMVISLFIVISLGLIFYVKYNRLKNID